MLNKTTKGAKMTIHVKRINQEWRAKMYNFEYLPINIPNKASRSDVVKFLENNAVNPDIKFKGVTI